MVKSLVKSSKGLREAETALLYPLGLSSLGLNTLGAKPSPYTLYPKKELLLVFIPAAVSGMKHNCKSERTDYKYQNSHYNIRIHVYDLLMFFVSAAQSGIKDNSKYQETDCNDQIKNHNFISWCHWLTPFIKDMLNIQHTAVNRNPEINLKILKLKGATKNGTTRIAKRTSPITINISESLSNCECENSNFIGNAIKELLLIFCEKCWKKKQNNSHKEQSSDNVESFQRSNVDRHQEKLPFIFRKQSRQRNKNNCNQNQSSSDVKSFHWSYINSHLLTPFTRRMLISKDVALNASPNNSILKSNLFCIENKGRTIDAKNTNDKLAENSDNLFSWESFSDRFIDNDDTMDKLVKSRAKTSSKVQGSRGMGEEKTEQFQFSLAPCYLLLDPHLQKGA